MKSKQAAQEQENYVMLEKNYVLRLKRLPDGVEGDVIMLDAKKPGQATHLFDAPKQSSVDELSAWARQALEAFREG
ncbi:hypothetical protein [Paenibacillus cremeus]|uniref:Uncharacterized protein n=1 Tax=Paenibacillus cremeus TaxID=2163881 RepID=A0A559K844_9BACL|nr:hypothetical protein [Paenibacillus cremeus]TVY08300.1 hypothetical protein FPZ49_19755 [Paenibacillus cremeus]